MQQRQFDPPCRGSLADFSGLARHRRVEILTCDGPAVPSLLVKLLKVKTARFTEVVDKSGKPEVYTLWQKPSADRHFQSLNKNNRVMTIQKGESGTDFGVVGFKERKGASYLVFPKSLKRFAGKRIVGINWDLVR